MLSWAAMLVSKRDLNLRMRAGQFAFAWDWSQIGSVLTSFVASSPAPGLFVVDEAQMISRVDLLDSVARVLLNLLGSRHSSSWAALRCVPASSDMLANASTWGATVLLRCAIKLSGLMMMLRPPWWMWAWLYTCLIKR